MVEFIEQKDTPSKNDHEGHSLPDWFSFNFISWIYMFATLHSKLKLSYYFIINHDQVALSYCS